MTEQFHEGQEVEVTDSRYPLSTFSWRKANIVARVRTTNSPRYEVQFQCSGGLRAVFDAAYIRVPKLVLDVSHADDFINKATP